ncbi:C-C chemokine receptor type 4 [Mugil cephalus]|uniref:C-C chemokine receptor type 4 n=1 Tax=Mugil cephalus TaxID=48193 RepID=UPI001FB77726|nr:C-C chemokine receptor type 4 [Mugil cephalus]
MDTSENVSLSYYESSMNATSENTSLEYGQSMYQPENESLAYLEYDYSDICGQDNGPEFFIGPMVSTVLYYVLFGVGLIGNSAVLWVLLRYIKLKTMTDVCLLNLALSDLLVALSLPVWASGYQDFVACKLTTGVYQLGFYSGTLFVTLMSVDRYLAIVHAVAAMRARTLCYGIIASIVIWVVSVAMALPQVIFAALELNEENNSSECQPLYPDETQYFWKLLRNFRENILGLFVCLPIMIFCYVNILVVLSKSRNSKKAKAVKLIFTVVCVFVVCWVPYNVVIFLETLELLGIIKTCGASKAIVSAMSYAEIIALSHCCVNPVIYAFIGEKFRKSLGKVLPRYFCWSHTSWGTVSQRDTTETSNTAVKSEH